MHFLGMEGIEERKNDQEGVKRDTSCGAQKMLRQVKTKENNKRRKD